MGKPFLVCAFALISITYAVAEGAEKSTRLPLPPLSKTSVEKICANLLSSLPNLPVSEEALRAYISANDIGHGNYMYRLSMMKGEIDGRERYVFFLGENHMSGPLSYSAGNKVIDEFNILAVEDLVDTGKKSKNRMVRWTTKMAEIATPALRMTSALARGHAETLNAEKTVIKLEANHSYSEKMNLNLRSEISIASALGLYFATIIGPIEWTVRAALNIQATHPLAAMKPTLPEAIIGGIHFSTGLYILLKLKGLNAEAEKEKNNTAANSLGLHSYFMRQKHQYDVVFRRDSDMTSQLIEQFHTNPDMDYALVMIGKAHVPGMMKLLQRQHAFDRIPLGLKNEAAQDTN